MCVRVYICVCIYIYVHMYVYIYIYKYLTGSGCLLELLLIIISHILSNNWAIFPPCYKNPFICQSMVQMPGTLKSNKKVLQINLHSKK